MARRILFIWPAACRAWFSIIS